jgi:DNA polymerase III sliding clamp (beta) subunit (PCNA family)
MPRVTLLASTLHRLLAPVLPHTATGQDTAPLNAVRFEVLGNVLYLTGSDTHTLAVTRYRPSTAPSRSAGSTRPRSSPCSSPRSCPTRS